MTLNKKESRGYLGFLLCVLIIFVSTGLWFLYVTNGPSLLGKPSLGIDDINSVQGFTGTTITFRIYNSGNAASENTKVTIEIYPEEGQILESKTIYIGKLNPGESKQMTTKMESANIKNGSVRIIPSQ